MIHDQSSIFFRSQTCRSSKCWRENRRRTSRSWTLRTPCTLTPRTDHDMHPASFALVVAGRDPSVVIVEMMFIKLVDSQSPSRVRCQMASSMCAGTVLLESLPKQTQLFFISFYQRSGQCMLGVFNALIFPLAFPSYQCPGWRWFRQGLDPVWCWSCTSTWRAPTVHQSSANRSGKMPAHSHGKTWGTSTAELLQWIWLADWSPNSKVLGFRISKHQNHIEFLVSHVPVTAFQRTPQCADLPMLCCSSSCMVVSMIWLMFHPHPTYLQTIWKLGSFSLAWLPLIATVMAPSKNLSSLATVCLNTGHP